MTPVTTQPARTTLRLLALAGAALACAAPLAGCRGDRSSEPPRQFFPGMDDQPKWEPQAPSEFFADGRMMRLPPENTVAFGRQQFVSEEDWAEKFMQQREDLLKSDTAYYTGKGSDGRFVEVAPVAFTREDLLRGAERFNIHCAVCHNYNGDGLGLVGRQWSYALPNFHDDKYVDPSVDQGRDGYLFQVARMGVPGGTPEQPDYVNSKMPGYGYALSYDDSWRIVGYIRALQASRRGTIEDVPEAQRPALQRALEDIQRSGQASAQPQASATQTNGGAR